MYSRPTKSSSNGDLGSPIIAYFFQSMFEIYVKEHGAKSVALGCTNIASERCIYISVVYSGVDVCVA